MTQHLIIVSVKDCWMGVDSSGTMGVDLAGVGGVEGWQWRHSRTNHRRAWLGGGRKNASVVEQGGRSWRGRGVGG